MQLLLIGAGGFVFFLLAGIITSAVLRHKRKKIENAITVEYEHS